MNPNNYTINHKKLLLLQQLAFDLKHPSMDTFHLLGAILETDTDVTLSY